jgi:hypothetical protein
MSITIETNNHLVNCVAKCVSSVQLQVTRLPLQSRIFLSVTDHLTPNRAAIEARQIFFH